MYTFSQVLHGYVVCNEDSFLSGGVSPWKLLPLNLPQWPTDLQLGCLAILRDSLSVDVACGEVAGVGNTWSATFMQPLLLVRTYADLLVVREFA